MSYADEVFKSNCREILQSGVSHKDHPVRPSWEDGTSHNHVKAHGI